MNLNEQIKQTIDRYNTSMVNLCTNEFHVAPESVESSCTLDTLQATVTISQQNESKDLTNILVLAVAYHEKGETPSLVFSTRAYNLLADKGVPVGIVPSTACMDLSSIEEFKNKLHTILVDEDDVAPQVCKFEEAPQES